MSIVQAVVDYGERYADLVAEMHDALVLLARLEVEHTGVVAMLANTPARRRVTRRRTLAHALTIALREVAAVDERYPATDRNETRKGVRAS